MQKPKKIIETFIKTNKEVEQETTICNCREELKNLLIKRTPSIFDREPNPSFNGNLDKLVDEIINLTNC